MSDRETVPGTVVVGVDGSEGSLHALDWAIDAAAGRGATLRLVYAMGLPLVTVPLGGPIRTAPSPEVSQAAKALLEEALRRVQEAAPSLRAVTEVSRAEAHHALGVAGVVDGMEALSPVFAGLGVTQAIVANVTVEIVVANQEVQAAVFNEALGFSLITYEGFCHCHLRAACRNRQGDGAPLHHFHCDCSFGFEVIRHHIAAVTAHSFCRR